METETPGRGWVREQHEPASSGELPPNGSVLKLSCQLGLKQVSGTTNLSPRHGDSSLVT